MCTHSDILVSFIIPHKNIPNLLQRCVSTIPRRKDIEIIIVDDNSDPSIVDFEKFPFLHDRDVKIIFDKSGKRQGHARNIGIEKSRGEWVFFIDSDDYFFYGISQAIDGCKISTADIRYYKSVNLDSETYLPSKSRSSITNGSIDSFLSEDEWGEHMIRYRHPVPWGKFIRRSLIEEHHIRFPEIEKAEDFEFSYLCGHYAKKVEANNIAVYCVTSREGNLTSTITPTETLVVAKNEIKFLSFMIKNGLNDTPAYKIIEQDVFALIESMRANHKDYYEGLRSLDACGFSDSYKKRMLAIIVSGRRHAKIKARINRILHFYR